MKYLNSDYMKHFDKRTFREADPYPYAVFEKIINPDSYELLINNLPDIKFFEKSVGKERAYGQKSHDRYILEYEDKNVVPECWNEFIKELESPEYQNFLAGLFGTRFFKTRYHWHYSYAGCSVSPHADGLSKLGSQVFYLNTEHDWKLEWGGDTRILRPIKPISRESNPDFDDFEVAATSGPFGNVSLLFQRKDNAWHGVEQLKQPGDVYRKVFILVMDLQDPKLNFKKLLRRFVDRIKSVIFMK